MSISYDDNHYTTGTSHLCYILINTHVSTHAHTHKYVRIYKHTCVWVCVCMCVCEIELSHDQIGRPFTILGPSCGFTGPIRVTPFGLFLIQDMRQILKCYMVSTAGSVLRPSLIERSRFIPSLMPEKGKWIWVWFVDFIFQQLSGLLFVLILLLRQCFRYILQPSSKIKSVRKEIGFFFTGKMGTDCILVYWPYIRHLFFCSYLFGEKKKNYLLIPCIF